MTTTTGYLSTWKNEPRICLFIKDGFLRTDRVRIVNRKRKAAGYRNDAVYGFIVCRVEVKAVPSQRRPSMTHVLLISPEWIQQIVTGKKPRGKHAKGFASTAALKRRLDAFERTCDVRFEVLLQAINQLMGPKGSKRSRAKTSKKRRGRR